MEIHFEYGCKLVQPTIGTIPPKIGFYPTDSHITNDKSKVTCPDCLTAIENRRLDKIKKMKKQAYLGLI